jgi:hypothetical protein
MKNSFEALCTGKLRHKFVSLHTLYIRCNTAVKTLLQLNGKYYQDHMVAFF